MAASALGEGRRGKNIRHHLLGLLRQAVYGRLAGYEDVNDAERLARDPAMRAIVGREGIDRPAASTSQMGRFETEWLATEANLAALADLSGAWIDRVHRRRPPDGIILDMDSSESPTHGQQEGSAWNGHFGCTCYHPLFVFNQFGDLERSALRPGNVHSAEGWRAVLEPVIARYRERGLAALLPWRRGVRQARAVRAAGGGGDRLRHPPAGQSVLQERIGHLLTRPVGRPPNKPQVFFASFSYQAQSWSRPRRVVAKVEWHQGELYPRVGFIVTNLKRPAERVSKFYNGRGTAEQWIRRASCAALDAAVLPRLPPQRRAAPAPRPGLQPRQLPALAGPASGGRAVVADDFAREAGQDRRTDRPARPLRGVPARRGRRAAGTVRRDPAPDRAAAATLTTAPGMSIARNDRWQPSRRGASMIDREAAERCLKSGAQAS